MLIQFRAAEMAGMSGGSLGLMALNDTKAGMEGLDKESISKVSKSNIQSPGEIHRGNPARLTTFT